MEFLVTFGIQVPDGTPPAEVADRERAEEVAAAKLAAEGRLERVWKRPLPGGETEVLGLYRADTQSQLEGLLAALPLYDWMTVTVTPLEAHPNDPAAVRPAARWGDSNGNVQLPEPRLSLIYRLEATLGEPVELGKTVAGDRRIVPLVGGKFRGPELSGELVPGSSADWQRLLPDGTAIADLRYLLKTDEGIPLYVRARGVRHGTPRSWRALPAASRSTPAGTPSAPQLG